MYAHPSFVRDKPSGLLQLQKITTKSRRRSVSASSGELRSVSPPLSSAERLTQGLISSLLKTSHAAKKIVVHGFTGWDQSNPAQISPGRHYSFAQSESDTSSTGDNDRGKLDLLALALEQQEFATRP